MKQTVYFSDFTAAFHRADRGNQFTYDALHVLYDYLTEAEESIGEELELDVIALCCEYTEQTADEVIECYPADFEADELAEMTDEEKFDLVFDYLSNKTICCGTTNENSFVYLQF